MRREFRAAAYDAQEAIVRLSEAVRLSTVEDITEAESEYFLGVSAAIEELGQVVTQKRKELATARARLLDS